MGHLIEPDPEKVELEKQSMLFYKQWIGKITGEEVNELRELHTGRVYVELMKAVLPKCLDKEDMKQVSFENSKKNMKLLQKAFKTVNLKTVVPVKALITKEFHANYEFIAWLHAFFTVNKLYKNLKNEPVQKEIRKALEKTIKTSKELIKECTNILNPVMHNVVQCMDFEDTYLSEEFETLKSACAKYEKVVKRILTKEGRNEESDRKFVEGLRELYKFAMEAGEIGSRINLEYKHLESYPKEDRMVKHAAEVIQAGLKCIKLTRKAAVNMQMKFNDVDVETYDEGLNKNLNDVKECLHAAAENAKLKFPSSETPVNSNNSSERVTWTKIHEARIRAEVILNVHSDKL